MRVPLVAADGGHVGGRYQRRRRPVLLADKVRGNSDEVKASAVARGDTTLVRCPFFIRTELINLTLPPAAIGAISTTADTRS